MLGALVPDWAGTAEAAGEQATIVLAEGVLRLMAEWSSTARVPTVLVVEDLHWSDPETLKVIEYLTDNLVGQPIVVVAIVREGEQGAGVDLIGVLEARRAVTVIDVGALDVLQSEAVLRACLRVAAVPADLVDAVVARSDGVPFFIEELVATALGRPDRTGCSCFYQRRIGGPARFAT